MKKVIFSIAVFLFSCNITQGQWHPSSILFSPTSKWSLSFNALYEEIDWQAEHVQWFDRQGKALLGFAVTDWFKLSGNIGYGKFMFRPEQIDEIRFDPDYHFGGSLYFGPFILRPNLITVSTVLSGEWFNPYGKREIFHSSPQNDWQETQEFILENLNGGLGINFTFQTKRFDFFAGPVITSRQVTLKYQFFVNGDGYAFDLERVSETYRSNFAIGYFGGVGIKLPGNYYLNLEIKNDNINNFVALFSIAQIGSPK